jgi:hypothetical protein
MSDNSPRSEATLTWPLRIVVHLYDLRLSGYLRVTEKDLIRQWENLSTSIRTHLTYLEERGFVELTIANKESCFVRLTERGIALVEAGIRESQSSS